MSTIIISPRPQSGGRSGQQRLWLVKARAEADAKAKAVEAAKPAPKLVISHYDDQGRAIRTRVVHGVWHLTDGPTIVQFRQQPSGTILVTTRGPGVWKRLTMSKAAARVKYRGLLDSGFAKW